MYDKQILNNLGHGYLYTPTNTLSDTTFFFKLLFRADYFICNSMVRILCFKKFLEITMLGFFVSFYQETIVKAK